jgi:hypothetical protein
MDSLCEGLIRQAVCDAASLAGGLVVWRRMASLGDSPRRTECSRKWLAILKKNSFRPKTSCTVRCSTTHGNRIETPSSYATLSCVVDVRPAYRGSVCSVIFRSGTISVAEILVASLCLANVAGFRKLFAC